MDETVTVTLFDETPIQAIDVDCHVPVAQAYGVRGVLYIPPSLARKPEWVEAAQLIRQRPKVGHCPSSVKPKSRADLLRKLAALILPRVRHEGHRQPRFDGNCPRCQFTAILRELRTGSPTRPARP